MIDRFLARRGWFRWPERNGNRDSDAIARGQRWQAFYNEPGGVGDVLDALRKGYFEKAAHLDLSETDKLLSLSLASRIVAELDTTLKLIIVQGEAESAAAAHADKIARLPEPMRRRL